MAGIPFQSPPVLGQMPATSGMPPSAAYAYQIMNGPGFSATSTTGASATPINQLVAT